MAFIATCRLDLGGGNVVEAGQTVAEAANWRNVNSYIRCGKLFATHELKNAHLRLINRKNKARLGRYMRASALDAQKASEMLVEKVAGDELVRKKKNALARKSKAKKIVPLSRKRTATITK